MDQDSVPREPTRLMLVIEMGDGALQRLEAACGVAEISSAVIRPIAGVAFDAGAVRGLVTAGQSKGVAVLIEGDARLARTLKADGVHVPVSDDGAGAYGEAREIVGSGSIVGIDVGRSRHDAMTAGEDGADFIGFGIPAFVKDRDASAARRLELVAWWAEIFEVPCVAFDVDTIEDARDLAEAGADFIAVTALAGTSPAAVADRVRAFADALRDPETAG